MATGYYLIILILPLLVTSQTYFEENSDFMMGFEAGSLIH